MWVLLHPCSIHSSKCIGVGDRGLGGCSSPTLEKTSKISLGWAEVHPKLGENSLKQWIFYWEPPKFFLPYAHVKMCNKQIKLNLLAFTPFLASSISFSIKIWPSACLSSCTWGFPPVLSVSLTLTCVRSWKLFTLIIWLERNKLAKSLLKQNLCSLSLKFPLSLHIVVGNFLSRCPAFQLQIFNGFMGIENKHLW